MHAVFDNKIYARLLKQKINILAIWLIM